MINTTQEILQEQDFIFHILDVIGYHHDQQSHYVADARFNNVYHKNKEDTIAELTRYLKIFDVLRSGQYPIGYLNACRQYLAEFVERFGDDLTPLTPFVQKFDEVFYG